VRLEKPDNRLAIGKGGSGKSTLVRSWLKERRRVLIHDTNAEPELAALASDVIQDRGALVERLLQGGPFVIAWRGFLVEQETAFEFANEAALAAENVLVVWEELDVYFDGSGSHLPGWAYKIVHVGRHKGMRTIATSRAPALIPKKLTRNVQRIAIFRTDEPRDIQYLAEKVGTATAALIPTLAAFQYLDWNEGGEAAAKKKTKP